MFLQLVGAAMGTKLGTKFAPPYACLSAGYLEEIISTTITLTFYIN